MSLNLKTKKLKIALYLGVFPLAILIAGIILKDNAVTIIASLVAIVYVYFLSENLRIAFVFCFAFAVLFGVTNFIEKLYASAAFHGLMLAPIAAFRFFTWNKNKGTPPKIKSLSIKNWFFVALLAAILVVSFYYILAVLNDSQPLLDAVHFTVSCLMSFAMLFNYRELWYFGMSGTLLSIAIWSIQLYNTGNGISVLILQCLVAIINIYGMYNWRKTSLD